MIRRRFLTLLATAPIGGAIVRASSVVPFVPCPQAPAEAFAADFSTDGLIFRAYTRHVASSLDPRAIWGTAVRDSIALMSDPHFLNGQRGPSSLVNAPQA